MKQSRAGGQEDSNAREPEEARTEADDPICGYRLIQSKKIPALYISAEPIPLLPPPPWLKYVYPPEEKRRPVSWVSTTFLVLVPVTALLACLLA